MNIWTPFHYEYHFNNLQINKQNSNVAITIFSLYRLIVIKNSLKLAKNVTLKGSAYFGKYH